VPILRQGHTCAVREGNRRCCQGMQADTRNSLKTYACSSYQGSPRSALKVSRLCCFKGLFQPYGFINFTLNRFENVEFTCEWKYDGERAQIHLLEDGSIRIYSRNQEDNTSKYPDIIQRFKSCIDGEVKTCILDSEAVAWDREKKQIQPFQVFYIQSFFPFAT